MSNLLERAINCSDGDQAAKIIQNALGIESDEVANYVFPTDLADRPRAAGSHHRRMSADRARFFGRCPAAASRRPGPPTKARLHPLLTISGLSIGRCTGLSGQTTVHEGPLVVLASRGALYLFSVSTERSTAARSADTSRN